MAVATQPVGELRLIPSDPLQSPREAAGGLSPRFTAADAGTRSTRSPVVHLVSSLRPRASWRGHSTVTAWGQPEAQACLSLSPHGPFSAVCFCPGPRRPHLVVGSSVPEPLSSGSLVSFGPSHAGAFGGLSCGLCPQWACLACPLVGLRSGILGGGPAVPPRSPLCAGAEGSDARLPLGLVTLVSLVGGVYLFPPWLISYPWGDFRPGQHPVPVNFLPVGSVFLTTLPNPVRLSSVSPSLLPAGQCPGDHAFQSNRYSAALHCCHYFDV